MVSTRSNGKFIPGFYNHRSLAKNSIQNKNKITQLFQTKKTKKKTKANNVFHQKFNMFYH